MPEKPKTTPKDFFLWAGAMITLYASAVSVISLIFNYLNYAIPDALTYYSGDPYQGGISYEMASLIVLFPLFMFLSHLIINDVKKDSTRAEIWVRRWAIYLTLFVAGATIAGDLITLIMYFFNGDVSMRFVLKVFVLFLVMSGIFLHYLADLRGYWTHEPARARSVRWASLVLVIITIVAGFFIVGTPWQARLYRLDDQKVSDLQNIQSQVVSYWQAKQQLPASLSDLSNTISGYSAPQDPQSGAAYEYKASGAQSFELCATFNAPTQPFSLSRQTVPAYPGSYGGPSQDNWSHAAGNVCFERTIDPALYPPISKKPIGA